jgi:hypothetical protein
MPTVRLTGIGLAHRAEERAQDEFPPPSNEHPIELRCSPIDRIGVFARRDLELVT